MFCVNSSGISTQKQSWKDTLGLELFKATRGKKRQKVFVGLDVNGQRPLYVYSRPFHTVYVRSLNSPSDFICFLWTDLVRETGIFTAVPGWSVLKTAGLALAAQVGFSCQVTCRSESEFQLVPFPKFHSNVPFYSSLECSIQDCLIMSTLKVTADVSCSGSVSCSFVFASPYRCHFRQLLPRAPSLISAPTLLTHTLFRMKDRLTLSPSGIQCSSWVCVKPVNKLLCFSYKT